MQMKKKLLDLVRDKIRFKHYSIKTEQSYTGWIKRYIVFHDKKHPIEMGKREIEEFLTYLAVKKRVSPTTQLIVYLMYGCGLRMSEALNIRIKDIDFGFNKIYIWDSKSLKDRTVPLPQKLKAKLLEQVEIVENFHKLDLENGYGSIFIPYALEKKYPKLKFETKWRFLEMLLL